MTTIRNIASIAAFVLALVALALVLAVHGPTGKTGARGPSGPTGAQGQAGSSANTSELGVCVESTTFTPGVSNDSSDTLVTSVYQPSVTSGGAVSCPSGNFVQVQP